MNAINNILQTFQAHTLVPTQRRERMEPETARTLQHYLQKFVRETEYNGAKGQELTISFRHWLAAQDYAASTKQMLAISLGRFFSENGFLSSQDFESLKKTFRIPTRNQWSSYSLTTEQIGKALTHILHSGRPFARFRNASICAVLATLGPRIGQLLSAPVTALEMRENHFSLSLKPAKGNEKGGEREPVVRKLPYKEFAGIHTGDILSAWLEIRARKCPASPWLFCNRKGEQLTQRYVQKTFAEISGYLEIPELNPHAFRHHVITRVAGQHDAVKAQLVAGHAHLSTTQGYINPEIEKFDTLNIL